MLARFDLAKTWREFTFAFFIPSTLFIISFIALCVITRTVKVDDDAKMRCKYCTEGEINSDIDDELNNERCMVMGTTEEVDTNENPHESTSNV